MPLNKRDVYLGRGLGAWAFWLHRLTGLALAFYLLHAHCRHLHGGRRQGQL